MPCNWHACFFREGGVVSRAANRLFGINATGGVHDPYQNFLSHIGGNLARNVFNIPGMFGAAALTYGAYAGQGLSTLTDDQLVGIATQQNYLK